MNCTIFLCLFSFMLMIATLSLVANDNEHDEEYLGYVTKLRLLSQEITQQALQEAARGNELGFQTISNAQSEYKNLLETLTNGNPESGMSGTPSSTALKNLRDLWEKGESSLQNLLETQETITHLHKDSDVMDQLFEKNDTLIETMISAKASPNQIFLATQQLLWLERIKHNLLNDSEKKDEKALNEKAIRQFGHNLSVLMSGSDTDRQLKAVASPEAQAILEEILVLFDKDIKKFFLDNSEEIYKAKRALQEIKKLNPLILERIEKLQEAYVDASKQRFISPTLGNGLAVIVLFLLLIFLYMIIRINKARTQEMEQQFAEIEAANHRNQEAILRLLTEIADLADGDLTVNATVTEDFTGAIADAINFSIEALRDLVIRINRTAEQVTGAAQSTRKTAGQLTKASERLAQQIAKGGQAVIGMATAIKTISAKAKESADVAIKVRQGTLHPPTDNTDLLPVRVSFYDEGATTVAKTSIRATSCKAGTKHGVLHFAVI
ncbi:methyl-accepting chemotaxis sensory transducer [Candidatus Thiomargarita nelsonii]|uniref:Methyl-accepting chemotaxis sensory transducer n=1 Tax=Candidatus Thiomargarita nelsonii TaxID=1003181 RepID=A0A176RVH9_9GAMM|nr:methyl-accepting chemotaxis sensory transducer [Candidatus Thiomargarita nelsonii]